ncbi:MAG: SRPBCC family protein [Acidimicrobiales bacterium]
MGPVGRGVPGLFGVRSGTDTPTPEAAVGRWVATGLVAIGSGAALVGGCVGVVTGAVTVDLDLGRRTRPLGPQTVEIAAAGELIFDVVAAPYLARQPRAVEEKIRVLERGTDMVLAAHRTPVRGRLVATTVETVRFIRPDRVDFRLVRGPVPYVVEQFVLTTAAGARTRLEYSGELGTDLWWIGQRWGDRVAAAWERAVAASLESVKVEAERRAAAQRTR